MAMDERGYIVSVLAEWAQSGEELRLVRRAVDGETEPPTGKRTSMELQIYKQGYWQRWRPSGGSRLATER